MAPFPRAQALSLSLSLALAACLALCWPGDAAAKTINVGGDAGWVIQKYPGLAVRTGDTLNFTWPPSMIVELHHNVFLFPNFKAYNACDFSRASFKGLNNVMIKVRKSGTAYYGCGMLNGHHCLAGQRVKVTA